MVGGRIGSPRVAFVLLANRRLAIFHKCLFCFVPLRCPGRPWPNALQLHVTEDGGLPRARKIAAVTYSLSFSFLQRGRSFVYSGSTGSPTAQQTMEGGPCVGMDAGLAIFYQKNQSKKPRPLTPPLNLF